MVSCLNGRDAAFNGCLLYHPSPVDAFLSLCGTVDEQATRIETLETEVEVQASNTKGTHSRISKFSERVDEATTDSMNETSPKRTEQRPPQTQTPLETICSLPEDVPARELKTHTDVRVSS